ncbi:MAG: GFA family protein [Pseudomonadota bacterium]
MHVDGQCHCGALRFEAEVDAEQVKICHCTDCQILSGTAFRTVAPASEDRFRMLAGTPKIYLKTAESGRPREQAFCRDCGTQIYATSVGPAPRLINIRVGTLRQRAELTPKHQIWCRSSAPWLTQIASLPADDRQ